MFRRRDRRIQVLLVHPGGPFWKGKEEGAWSIPKGEFGAGEEPAIAAAREFREETGFEPGEPLLALGAHKQPGGKTVSAWAFEGDCDPAALRSNTFEMEWPPRSGRQASFPEVDRAEWFALPEARRRIHKGQVPFLDTLEALAGS